jgi:hypothetical protein
LCVRRDGIGAHRPPIAADDSGEQGRPNRLDLDLDEAGESGVLAVDRWDEDVDGLVRIGVVEPVLSSQVSGGRLRFRGFRKDETRPRERRGVSRVLLVVSLEQHHSGIERVCREDEEHRHATGKKDEDLTTLGTKPAEAPSC